MENEKQLTRTSKFLSRILRHDPSYVGLTLDDAGWVDVDKLLRAIKKHPKAPSVTRELLEQVVETNNKKRFEFNDKGTKIRARQGHSVNVDLGYEAQEPPEVLWHGTATKTIAAIKSAGLLRMNRHAVHLSKDYHTAYKVGMRHGKPLVLMIESFKMHANGHQFFLTENGVWYTEHVPTDFIVHPEDRNYRHPSVLFQ